ncbi:MAG TPA: CvpA family protein [Gaiellaceae bacterium]|nr:CvpA family protein [Gaiellaceae bacterium]
MTGLDWAIVGFAALTALAGFRRGLVRTLLSLAGLVAGAVLGARLAPDLLPGGLHLRYPALVAFGGALVGASLLEAAARLAGRTFRGALRVVPPLRLLDSVGGLAAGAVWGLAIVWVAGAAALQLPGHGRWRHEARTSEVLRQLNELAPPREVLRLRSALVERLPAGALLP